MVSSYLKIIIVLCFLSTHSFSSWARPSCFDQASFSTAETAEHVDGSYITLRSQVATDKGPFSYEIHAPKSHISFGHRVKEVLDGDSRALFNYFSYIPRGTTHFIVKGAQVANGAATVFPENIIWLNDYPPKNAGQLYSNKDWIRSLVLHELTHIIHMDQTTGFLKFLRFIFGSTGKLGGVVPRWFTEGVAVWAESQFGHGRLQHRGLRHDHLLQILSKNGCSTIDCLDEPGGYPFGSLSYWAGSFFLEFLEKKKSQTIACLVRANSDSIPFFLNSSFKECTGKSAVENFNLFKNELAKKFFAARKEIDQHAFFKKTKELKLPSNHAVAWYKGSSIKDDNFIYAGYDNKIEKLINYDLKTDRRQEYRPDHYLDNINGHNRYKNVVNLSLIEPFSSSKKKTVLYNVNSNKLSREFTVKKNFDYYFNLPKSKLFLALRYENSSWAFYKVNAYNSEKEYAKNLKPFFSLPKHIPLYHPISFSAGGQVFLGFLTNYGDEPGHHSKKEKYYFFVTKISGPFNLQAIIANDNPIEFKGICDSDLVFQDQIQSTIFINTFPSKQLGLNRSTSTRLSGLVANELVDFKMGKNHTILRYYGKNLRPRVYPASCKTFIGDLKKHTLIKQVYHQTNIKSFNQLLSATNKTQHKKQATKEKLIEEEEKKLNWDSYPSFRHYLPHYWMLYYNSGANLSSIQALTSVSDPNGENKLNLSGSYYTKIDELAPSINLQTNAFNSFSVGASHFRYYSRTTFSRTNDHFEETNIYVGPKKSWGSWQWSSQLMASKNRSKDFLSSRRYQKYGLRQTLAHLPVFIDDFWQLGSFNLNVYRQDNEAFEDFWAAESKLLTHQRWHPRFATSLSTSYGRLFKTGLYSGTLYGGGSTSDLFGSSYYHEFYPIPYSDIFGNRILTSRFQMEFLLSDVYNGSGLFPLYMKDFSLIAGVEYLDAQRVYVDEKIRRNSHLSAAHFGIRTDLTVFYLAKIQLDILISQILNESVVNEPAALSINLKGRLF